MSTDNGQPEESLLCRPGGMLAEDMPQVTSRLRFDGHVPVDSEVMPVGALGGGLRLLSEKRGELTHERAVQILELPEFIVAGSEVDRPLRDAHVTYLLSCAKRGTFHPEWVSIISCVCLEAVGDRPPNSEFRMNGQHTCWMRIGMPEDWPCPIKFLRYEAAAVADMRVLYASVDRNAPRTTGNILNSYLAGTELFAGVPRRVIKNLAQGMAFWLWGEQSQAGCRHDADDTAYRIQTEYRELARVIIAWLLAEPQQSQGHLTRRAVLAAMFETFNKVPTKAPEFWSPVRNGVGLNSVNDARLKLREFLKAATVMGSDTPAGAGKSKATGKRLVSSEEMYRQCVHCWNAWRQGRGMETLRAPVTGKRPKAK